MKAMITTVCMNPSFDKTARVDKLLPGETHILSDIRYDIGGKGINVALALNRLGAQVSCVGCLGAEDEGRFMSMLPSRGISFDYLLLPGKVRTNLKLLDCQTREVTELNEPGPTMHEAQLEAFFQLVQEQAENSSYVTLSGKLPVGCPPETYQKLMERLTGPRIVLDAVGECLRCGVQGKPFLVKPNLSELEGLVSRKLGSLPQVRDAALMLIDHGAQNVMVSMGKEGALFTDGKKMVFSPALAVEAKSTVGAGDAMLGGVLMGLSQGQSLRDAFRYGVAAGAASVMTYGTAPLNLANFEALLPKVTEQEI